jgi:hypothetical protein
MDEWIGPAAAIPSSPLERALAPDRAFLSQTALKAES